MLAKTNRLKSAIDWKQILLDIWHLLTVLGVIYFMGYLHLPQCVHSDVSTHGRVYTLGPELHKDLSLHYRVLCFTWTCLLYRSLTCTWTLLISTCTAPMSTQTASRSIISWLISNLTASTCPSTVIQSFSQLYMHSHGLYNNLKALVNPYPKWKERKKCF